MQKAEGRFEELNNNYKMIESRWRELKIRWVCFLAN